MNFIQSFVTLTLLVLSLSGYAQNGSQSGVQNGAQSGSMSGSLNVNNGNDGGRVIAIEPGIGQDNQHLIGMCQKENGLISTKVVKGCEYKFCTVYDGNRTSSYPLNRLTCTTSEGYEKAQASAKKEVAAYVKKREHILITHAPLDHNLDGVVDAKDDLNGDGVVDLKDARSGSGNPSRPDAKGVIGMICHSKSGICSPNYDRSTNLDHTLCPEYLDIYLLTGSSCLKECQLQITKLGEKREIVPRPCAKCLAKFDIIADEHFKLSIVEGMVSIKRECLQPQVNQNEGGDQFERRGSSVNGNSGGGSGGNSTQQQ